MPPEICHCYILIDAKKGFLQLSPQKQRWTPIYYYFYIDIISHIIHLYKYTLLSYIVIKSILFIKDLVRL